MTDTELLDALQRLVDDKPVYLGETRCVWNDWERDRGRIALWLSGKLDVRERLKDAIERAEEREKEIV